MDTSEYLGLFLDESRESLQALNASLLDLEREPTDPEPLAVIFRVAHSLKGMSATMGFGGMARLTHRMEEVLAAMRDGGAPVTPAAGDALFSCLDTLQEMVDRIAAGDGEEVDASGVVARLDQVASGRTAHASVEVAATSAPPAGNPTAPTAAVAPGGAPGAADTRRSASTVRVATHRLDALMSLTGEMVIQRGRLTALADEHPLGDLRGAVEEMGRVTDDLEALVIQLRMMPAGAVFMRFPRMVRDLGNALGKTIELVMAGEDTELDRAIIDGLGDPLVHMLRNAADHGLESPAERAAAGKDPVGRVHLSARLAGGDVVIEVRDDGRGIDPAALRASAVSTGVVDAAAAADLTDEQALDLVFVPGVTTAGRTTDVSGRGVGMDAVRTAAGDLGGDVSIASVRGEGSVVTIRIPFRAGGCPAAPPGGPAPGAGARRPADGGSAQPSARF